MRDNRAVLFGHDPEPRLVAAEPHPDGGVLLYKREESGITSCRHEKFSPFFWIALPLPGSRRLEGNLHYNHLLFCESWKAWEALKKELKAAGVDFYAPSDPVQQYLLASGKTLFKDMAFDDLRRLQLDIETCTDEGFEFSNPDRDPLAAIALSDNTGWEQVLIVQPGSEESERQALETLNNLIAERDPDIIEGHNLFKFDLPFLARRARKYRIKLTWGRDGSPLASRSSRLNIAERTIQYTRFQAHGRHFTDTFVLVQLYDVATRELESFGLKDVVRHFGLSEPGRVILQGKAIAEAYHQRSPDFTLYALQDVRETRSLAATLSPTYFIQAQIFPYSFQDVMVRGNATRIDALLLRSYYHAGHSIPACPPARSYEGGYTDIFEYGVLQNVWHCDITSLYPSVMLSFGYAPANDELGIFPSMLSSLRTMRLDAKQSLRRAKTEREQKYFNALQSALKILINSFYGYLGFAQGHFADFDAAAEVTAKGREILRGMVDFLRGQGARVIEIDTDGIYFVPPTDVSREELLDRLSTSLPEGIEVEMERQYRAMFSYKAKNYALLTEEGTMIIKGAALKSRGLERFLREFYSGALRALLEGRPDDVDTLRREYEAAISERRWPVEMFCKTETLQDSPASYMRKIQASSRNRSAAFELAIKSGRSYLAGDQISYYITGNRKNVTAYEAAKWIGDWDPNNRDENIPYYLGKLAEAAKRFEPFVAASKQAQGSFNF